MKSSSPTFKIIRAFIEGIFLIIGIAYLVHLFLNQDQGFQALIEKASWLKLTFSFLLFAAIYLNMAYGLKLAVQKSLNNSPTISYYAFFSTISLSNLGKYIPGKIWSFLAFGHLGHKFGIPVGMMSGLFLINMLSGFSVAALLYILHFLPSLWAWAAILLSCIVGYFFFDPFFTAVFKALKFKWEIPKCIGVFWVVQVLNALISGCGYVLLAQSLGSERFFDFASIISYPVSYMVAYIIILVPAGVGVREHLIQSIDGDYPGSVITLLASRSMTISIDLIFSLVALFFLFQLKKNSIKKAHDESQA